MKILFLVPYPLDSAPSQRFRFEQYLGFLHEKGIRYKIQPFFNDSTWRILYKKGYKWKKFLGMVWGFLRREWQMWNIWSYDIIFIHREVAPIGPPAYELWLNLWKKKIIYDFDDAIWLPNTSEENKVVSRLKWHSKVADICSWAWKISAGNQYLAEFAYRHIQNVVVMPTTIDTNYHSPPRLLAKDTDTASSVVIGWTGSHSTVNYLKELVSSLNVLIEAYDFEFHIISNREPVNEIPTLYSNKTLQAKVKFHCWSRETEIEDLNRIDIGVMPMPDNEWTQGKCGFKALQFMALAKPVVASPVGVNNEIIQDGKNGFLASTNEEWIERLSLLIEEPELRKILGKAGRKTVVEKYSVEANKEKFLGLFKD